MKDHPKKSGNIKIHSQEILSLLKILQAFFTDDESEQQLFSQIKQLLADLDFDHLHTERAYLSFLILLFQAVMSQIPPDSEMHAQLQSIKQQIEPPIDLQSVDVLYQTVHSVAKKLQNMRVFSTEQASLVVNPIMMEYAIARKQAQARKAKLMAEYDPNYDQTKVKPTNVSPSKKTTGKISDSKQAFVNSTNENQHQSRPALRRNTAKIRPKPSYHFGSKIFARPEPSASKREQRRILGADRRSKTSTIDTLINGEEQNNYHKLIQGLQKDFVQQTRTAITQIEDFSEHIEQEIETLRVIEAIEDIRTYRDTVVATLEKLQDRHNRLASNFETARTYLSVIESGSQQLMDELDRVRLLSLTDELTGLPNRRAFLRRLQYEVSRVKRYQHPITLVIVDLDHFKAINDQYGHEGGDEVLKLYANKLFSLFRHHDSVARYGGEEFVMLFPDTSLPGVLKALEKIQEKCKSMTVTVSGVKFPLPSFSAGVVEYQRGESSEHFIARADKELYRAKRGGRSRVAYDQPKVPPMEPSIESDKKNTTDRKPNVKDDSNSDELMIGSELDIGAETDVEFEAAIKTDTETDIAEKLDTESEQEIGFNFEPERKSGQSVDSAMKPDTEVSVDEELEPDVKKVKITRFDPNLF